jgi:hypothetical protein
VSIRWRSQRDWRGRLDGAVEWLLDVTFVVDGEEKTATVAAAGGRPFRTTGPRRNYDAAVGWGWDARPPHLRKRGF